jgi:myo-inositol-1(or 4)-monophosphatase
MSTNDRATTATEIAKAAGELALKYFRQLENLKIERKGHQDFVSQADRDVETYVRAALIKAFPEDAIVGEEHEPKLGTSGFTWVIDPIDGTTNFINGIPAWTVVLAGVKNAQTEIGVIHDPCHGETYVAISERGATLNEEPLVLSSESGLRDGSIGVGFSNRTSAEGISNLVNALLAEGGVFVRNASGALSLAYVAAGRLLGYCEEHMNAWDCLAGQLLVAEAGGCVENQNADQMITSGGRVIVGAKGVYLDLLHMSEAAFTR